MATRHESSPRALVTGATGFVGRHLTARLATAGHQVTTVGRTPPPSARTGVTYRAVRRPGDIRGIVDELGPDVVFHLAAHQSRTATPSDIDAFLDANVALGTHLLDACVDSKAVVVQAMSYFQFRAGIPTPHSLYAATKQALWDIADYYRAVRGVDVRNAVLYDNYGPQDTRDKLLPTLLTAIRAGQAARVGPLDQRMNLLHVDDVVSGLIAAAAPGAPATMAIRAPDSVTLAELITTIERVLDAPLKIDVDLDRVGTAHPLGSDDWAAPPDWKPRVGLEAGLRHLIG